MKTLLITWFASALSLIIVAYIVPGFTVDTLGSALIAAVIIGLVNATLGLFLKVVTFPFAIITLGLLWLLINAGMLLLAARIVDGFQINGWLPAIFGSILLSIVNAVLRGILPKD